MGTGRRLLVMSAALNIVLGVVVVLARHGASEFEPARSADVSAQATQTVVLPSPIVTYTATNALPARILDWQAIESDDYKRYVANLRSAGCPEKTVRDVIVADINDLFRHRFRQLFPATNRLQYWKTSTPLADLYDEDRIAKQNELRREKRELVRALLGGDYSEEDDLSAIQLDSASERALDFLTAEKRTAVKELEDRFTVKMMQTYKSTWRGDDGPAGQVRADKDAALLEVLSPEEKFEYDLRKSDAAQMLRFGLGGFEVSEQEFRSLFPELKAFLEIVGKPGFGTVIRGEPDLRPEAGPARQAFKAKLLSILGPERFGQLVQQSRWNLNVEEQQ